MTRVLSTLRTHREVPPQHTPTKKKNPLSSPALYSHQKTQLKLLTFITQAPRLDSTRLGADWTRGGRTPVQEWMNEDILNYLTSTSTSTLFIPFHYTTLNLSRLTTHHSDLTLLFYASASFSLSLSSPQNQNSTPTPQYLTPHHSHPNSIHSYLSKITQPSLTHSLTPFGSIHSEINHSVWGIKGSHVEVYKPTSSNLV